MEVGLLLVRHISFLPPCRIRSFDFFPCHSEAAESSRLDIVVKEWNLMRSSQAIGQVQVPIQSVLGTKADQTKTAWYQLVSMHAEDMVSPTSHGSVHLRLQYWPSISIPAHQIAQSDFFKPDERDNWVQAPLSRELWVESPPRSEICLANVPAAVAQGYHVEDSRASVTSWSTSTADLFDNQANFPFYSHHLFGTDHVTYFGEEPHTGPILVALGSPDDQANRKVMVWTKREEKRFVVPNIAGYIRAIRAAYPLLANVQLGKTRSNRVQEALSK